MRRIFCMSLPSSSMLSSTSGSTVGSGEARRARPAECARFTHPRTAAAMCGWPARRGPGGRRRPRASRVLPQGGVLEVAHHDEHAVVDVAGHAEVEPYATATVYWHATAGSASSPSVTFSSTSVAMVLHAEPDGQFALTVMPRKLAGLPPDRFPTAAGSPVSGSHRRTGRSLRRGARPVHRQRTPAPRRRARPGAARSTSALPTILRLARSQAGSNTRRSWRLEGRARH